ncbi:MAG: glycosyltransferase family 4 protein [Saprospiraceae bacterium]|nr:glycosyltransferase family 4 protein [Saprospiraceae bacterium]
MKKIFLISYNLDGVTAGPSVRFQRYAPLFMEQGYRLTFITKWHDPALPPKESKEHYEVRRIRSNSKYLKHTLFIFKALCSVCFMRQLPEALLTFSCNTFQLWIMPLIKLRGIKLIFISTMDFSTRFTWEGNTFNKVKVNINKILYRFLYLNVYAIVASTAKLAESFGVFHLPEDKIKIIHNGVNTDNFYPVLPEQKRELRRTLQLPQDGKIILYVGLKTERKGILDLYEAWKLYSKSSPADVLVLVGNEKPDANTSEFNHTWEKTKKDIKEKSLKIILRDNTPDIAQYFQCADLFVFLSHKEGMPNVLLEAMASGLPIITTDFQGFSDDYGIHGKDIIVVERDTNAISNQIKQVLNKEPLYQLLSHNAVQKIKNNTFRNSVRAYIQLIKS